MPRNYVAKMKRTKIDPKTLQDAAEKVQSGSMSIKRAAIQFNIPSVSLWRFLKNMSKNTTTTTSNDDSMKQEDNSMSITTTKQQPTDNRKIFTEQHELRLVEYIVNCSRMFNKLTPQEIRKLAYDMAKSDQLKVPSNWDRNGMAGIDWLYSFRNRHSQLLSSILGTNTNGNSANGLTTEIIRSNNIKNINNNNNDPVSFPVEFNENQFGSIVLNLPQFSVNHPIIGNISFKLPTITIPLDCSNITLPGTS